MRKCLLAICVLVLIGAICLSASAEEKLHVGFIEAARTGAVAKVTELLAAGVAVNARDDSGRTALHYAAENGHLQTVGVLLKGGADPDIEDNEGHTALYYAQQKGHNGTAELLGAAATSTPGPSAGQSLNPGLKYRDLTAFETAIGQSACLLKSEHVYFFAPKRYERESGIVFPYLVKAYDALRRITGLDTEYIIVVYNFPAGHKDVSGGTSNCTLWYDDSNLRLGQQQEYTQYGIPHVSGYIEEMAHNFTSAAHIQFGWEMIGWTIGAKASMEVAGNPIFTRQVQETRRGQDETYRRYCNLGFTFPNDIPANQVDRIHAHILWQCEQKYGPSFWPDFFKEARKRGEPLKQAVKLSDGDAVRNERYRITVECFDSLPGLNFKKTLENAGISLTVDVKSLHPTDEGWNRKLR